MELSICKVCGKEVDGYPKGTLHIPCPNCWEVERRLSDYLKSENGKKFVREALEEAENKTVDKSL
jgi:hypothetical protein